MATAVLEPLGFDLVRHKPTEAGKKLVIVISDIRNIEIVLLLHSWSASLFLPMHVVGFLMQRFIY